MSLEPSPKPPVFPLRPIAARAHLQRPVQLPDYLPARMLNEFVYCPRLFFYEWVEGVFKHSSDTEDGAFRHERHDKHEDTLPPSEEIEDGEELKARSVTLSSEKIRLIAKIDLVEAEVGRVTPLDYKRGNPRLGDDGPEAWPADLVQICAQALVLRDNGYVCDEGILFYYGTKQRVRVAITEELVEQTLQALEEARKTALGGRIPPPLVDSPKCPRCSMASVCLPDETIAALGVAGDSLNDFQLDLFPDETTAEVRVHGLEDVRRLVPARDDLRPLYVTGYALSVGKSGERLQVKEKGALVQEVRLNELSQVSLFGPIQISGAAIQALCYADKPIAHFSMGGWFYGLTSGLGLKNVFLRREQFRRADDDGFCVRVAREIVASKIRNQRTLLQRNHVEPPPVVLDRLKRLAESARGAEELSQLLGIEGTAASLYFGAFNGMLKLEETDGLDALEFQHRNRRPPRDPVNALLSFAYSLLARDLTIACHLVGFDPFIGFYHQLRFGRPALALDLMEGFRPLIADSAVLSAINTRMVTPEDFLKAGEAVALTQKGRTAFLRAYEQRMDQLVTHPVFGYRISYRRVLEVQARLLARYLTGEIGSWPQFETR